MQIDSYDSKPEGGVNRRRGAQPGNLNAIKHGFYSRRLHELQKEGGLENEIAMVRLLVRRVSELAADPELDLTDLLKALDTLSSGADRLARLLRAQKEMDGAAPAGFNPVLERVLEKLTREKEAK